MSRFLGILLTLFLSPVFGFAQTDEIWQDNGSGVLESTEDQKESVTFSVENWISSQSVAPGQHLVGGYVQSIFHEFIDSALVRIQVDDQPVDSVYTEKGLFCFLLNQKGNLLNIQITHPDFHPFDTAMVFPQAPQTTLQKSLEPRYKILLKGRAYAGNLPLEGVDVRIRHRDVLYESQTKGCYYDNEDYWNCLYHGMFKQELTADEASDSIYIELNYEGMKPLTRGMTFNEYQGDIMELQMKYESILPVVPMNSINLKLSFPFMSKDKDWFVSMSYYRLVNEKSLRRLGYGMDASMYINTLTTEHKTFDELEPVAVDSSYIRGFIGPSVVFWLRAPEQRILSSYVGATLALNLSEYALSPQAFLGTRLFLDLNKAINLELRYAGFDMEVVDYQFNPYGNPEKYFKTQHFNKLHATLGVQIVF